MTAKILILTGDAAESLEVMYPYQRLREEGYEVHIAAPTAKRLQFVVHDFVDGFDTYTEKLGYTWPADVAFADVDPADYVALVIPGGRAPEYIRNDPDVKRIVAHFFSQDKPVAQICHAPLGRADAVVLPGSAADVARAVAWCYAHDVAIVPRGGGTGFAGGAVPVDGGVVVALERLTAVHAFDPEFWRIHVEAGLRTSEVRRL